MYRKVFRSYWEVKDKKEIELVTGTDADHRARMQTYIKSGVCISVL